MSNDKRVVSLRTPEHIENEASDWLVRLDGGNVSAADRKELKAWLAQDPAHAVALKSYATLWSDMDSLLNDLPDTADSPTPSAWHSMFAAQPAMRAMAAGVTICAIGIVAWMNVQSTGPETAFYATNVGVQQVVELDDGSLAHINTNSIIETEFSDSQRKVRLLRGEVKFDVVHDMDRPFTVYAGDRVVEAVGTAFVVQMTSQDNIVVTVTDGRVKLTNRNGGTASAGSASEPVFVSKGEVAVVDDRRAMPDPVAVQVDELDRRLSWLDGQLVFREQTLDQVVDEVSRYTPVKIVIDDAELRDLRFGGRFNIGDTDAVLDAIEIKLLVRVRRADDQTIHLSPAT